jgi:hypothetical protein
MVLTSTCQVGERSHDREHLDAVDPLLVVPPLRVPGGLAGVKPAVRDTL